LVFFLFQRIAPPPPPVIHRSIQAMVLIPFAEIYTKNAGQDPLDVYKVEAAACKLYRSLLLISDDQVLQTFEDTLGQSSNPQWFLARKNRVTASISHKVCK
jgi:hypothetical protein